MIVMNVNVKSKVSFKVKRKPVLNESEKFLNIYRSSTSAKTPLFLCFLITALKLSGED